MTALLSVSDKSGIVEFAKGLVDLGYAILSTGGTLKTLQENGIQALDVAQYTQSPEMFDGRVKTLHPKIHGGILYRRGNTEDKRIAEEFGIRDISLVCVNLYPFKATIERTDDFDEIDRLHNKWLNDVSFENFTAEEMKFMENYRNAEVKDAEKRIGANFCAFEVIRRAQRYFRLLTLEAPKIVCDNEEYLMLKAFIIHRFAVSFEKIA